MIINGLKETAISNQLDIENLKLNKNVSLF